MFIMRCELMVAHTCTSYLHTSVLLSIIHQELCAEASSVPPEELGEDEGETGAAEERG